MILKFYNKIDLCDWSWSSWYCSSLIVV